MAAYAILAGALTLAVIGTYMFLRPPATCGNCGTQLPKSGPPGSASYAASGRQICPNCGKTVDATGRVISD